MQSTNASTTEPIKLVKKPSPSTSDRVPGYVSDSNTIEYAPNTPSSEDVIIGLGASSTSAALNTLLPCMHQWTLTQKLPKINVTSLVLACLNPCTPATLGVSTQF